MPKRRDKTLSHRAPRIDVPPGAFTAPPNGTDAAAMLAALPGALSLPLAVVPSLYLFTHGSEIVYVGRTDNYLLRVNRHRYNASTGSAARPRLGELPLQVPRGQVVDGAQLAHLDRVRRGAAGKVRTAHVSTLRPRAPAEGHGRRPAPPPPPPTPRPPCR